VIDRHEFDDPVLADRFARLSAELRCPKCQNTNLSGSDAPIAQDLRAQVHDMLLAGKSDAEIKTYLVSRYGEFVLYRPRFAGTHLFLWLAPAALLVLGAVLLLLWLRRASGANQNLSAAEQDRALRLLRGEEVDP
ncbi:MAG: cytochrome c-type biogenesis protein, partial [Pseudomonadota bacterium]|nr:cytochrome c-type biogenesis protein [Pseudomonadota bacterium]